MPSSLTPTVARHDLRLALRADDGSDPDVVARALQSAHQAHLSPVCPLQPSPTPLTLAIERWDMALMDAWITPAHLQALVELGWDPCRLVAQSALSQLENQDPLHTDAVLTTTARIWAQWGAPLGPLSESQPMSVPLWDMAVASAPKTGQAGERWFRQLVAAGWAWDAPPAAPQPAYSCAQRFITSLTDQVLYEADEEFITLEPYRFYWDWLVQHPQALHAPLAPIVLRDGAFGLNETLEHPTVFHQLAVALHAAHRWDKANREGHVLWTLWQAAEALGLDATPEAWVHNEESDAHAKLRARTGKPPSPPSGPRSAEAYLRERSPDHPFLRWRESLNQAQGLAALLPAAPAASDPLFPGRPRL